MDEAGRLIHEIDVNGKFPIVACRTHFESRQTYASEHKQSAPA